MRMAWALDGGRRRRGQAQRAGDTPATDALSPRACRPPPLPAHSEQTSLLVPDWGIAIGVLNRQPLCVLRDAVVLRRCQLPPIDQLSPPVYRGVRFFAHYRKRGHGSVLISDRKEEGVHRSRFRVMVLLAFFLAFACAAAAIAGEGRRRASGMVPSDHQKCVGVPDCLSHTAEAYTIEPGQRALLQFSCPQNQPYFWNWDAAHHKHISLTLVGIHQSGLTIAAKNHLAQPGSFTVSLGCSSQQYSGTGYMTKKAHRRTLREEAQ